jgi:hypothetical protein
MKVSSILERHMNYLNLGHCFLGAIIIWKEYSFRVVLKEVFKPIVPLLEPMLGTIAAMQLHQ